MTISDDVMNDLLTLYLADEASPATRALVEQQARENVAFASRLDSARAVPPLTPPYEPARDVELRALSQTRQFLRLRSAFWASGILFTLLPLSFSFGGRLLILGPHPGLVWAFWSVAAASWVACYVMHRQIRHVGL
jgi:hypothetical protein